MEADNPSDGLFGPPMEIRLRDGTRVLLRPICRDDNERLRAALQRMSPESRYRRFMAPIRDFTPQQLAYLTEIDYRNHFALVALSREEACEPLIGVARYVRLPSEPEVAEAAVAVVDDYQRRGLGRLLLERLAITALDNGVRHFRGYFLADNWPMIHLLRKLGASLERDEPGILRTDVDLPEAAAELPDTAAYKVLREAARVNASLVQGAGTSGDAFQHH